MGVRVLASGSGFGGGGELGALAMICTRLESITGSACAPRNSCLSRRMAIAAVLHNHDRRPPSSPGWNTPRTRAVAVQHRLDEQSVVLGRDPDVPLAAGQQALDPFPLVIAERVAAHRSVLLFGQPAHNRPHAPTDPSIEGTP